MNITWSAHSPIGRVVIFATSFVNLPQMFARAVILLPMCKGVVCLKKFLSEFSR